MKFAKAGILYMGNVGRLRADVSGRPDGLSSYLVESAKSCGALFPSQNSSGRASGQCW
jgi:hypothetical protein